MKRILSALALLAAGPAFAADNAIVLTPGAGVIERSIDVGGLIQAPGVVPVSTTGAAIYGTAGVANANVLTVQGIASMTPMLATVTGTVAISGTVGVTQSTSPWVVSGTVTANQGTPPWTVNPGTAASWGLQAQGSATAAQLGVLNQAAVTTASPVYTTGQTSPLSLDTTGALRVNVTAGGAGGGAITAAASSYAATAFSVGAGTDGWDATQGAKADAAWTSGSGSAIAVLKAIDRDVLTPAALTPAGGAAPASNPSCATSTCQIKNGAGNLYGAYATCTAACWLFIINTTTTPVNATLTVGTANGNLADCIPVAAGLASSISYPTYPRAYANGIYAAVSSTACPVLTLVAPILVTGQAQ